MLFSSHLVAHFFRSRPERGHECMMNLWDDVNTRGRLLSIWFEFVFYERIAKSNHYYFNEMKSYFDERHSLSPQFLFRNRVQRIASDDRRAASEWFLMQ